MSEATYAFWVQLIVWGFFVFWLGWVVEPKVLGLYLRATSRRRRFIEKVEREIDDLNQMIKIKDQKLNSAYRQHMADVERLQELQEQFDISRGLEPGIREQPLALMESMDRLLVAALNEGPKLYHKRRK